MGQRAKELIAGIMKRYTDTAESFCITVGGYVAEAAGEIAENLRYYGGYLLAGLAVALAWPTNNRRINISPGKG